MKTDANTKRFPFYSLVIFIFLSVNSPTSIIAQDTYVQGYVILPNSDTVFGGIKDRNLYTGTLRKKIKFKKKKHVVKRYSPNELLGYFNGTHVFESIWYKEENDFLKTYFHSKPSYQQKEFLIVYAKGNVSLYGKEFTDGDSSYPDSFLLFKRTKDSFFIRPTQGIVLRKKALASYFKDCPALVTLLSDGKLKKPIEMLHYYNSNCGD